MRILVTGGAGYIGAQTVRRLHQRGDEVVVLDDLSSGHAGAVGEARLVVGSVGDAAALGRLFDEHPMDAIIHLAALKSVEESLTDPGRYFAVNVGGSLSLLRAAARAGVEVFVYSSSCAVYGSPDELPVSESSPLRPENPYGESKLLVERMLPWIERAHGIRSMSLRYFNAAGADPSGDLGEDWVGAANLVPRLMLALAGETGSFQLYGTDHPTPDGTAIRDYVHVVDLADAHLAALDYLAAGGTGTALNVGTGRGASVREIVDLAGRVSGRSLRVVEADRRPGDVAAIWADSRRAQEIIGWRPRYGLEDIVETAWRWHSRHPQGYPDERPTGASAAP